MFLKSVQVSNWTVRGNAVILVLLATALLAAKSARAAQIDTGQLLFHIDPHSGVYVLQSRVPTMTFQGATESAISKVATTSGHDRIGAYKRVAFQLRRRGQVVRASVRLYLHKPVALFAVRFLRATVNPRVLFPNFHSGPASLHTFSYADHVFAPPQFRAGQSGSPWLLFDDQLNAAIISPASHFLITTMNGDGMKKIAVGLNRKIATVPAGFRIRALMVITHGINPAWNLWGDMITRLTGKVRPSNDADWGLRHLGYWTGNGAGYFFNYIPKLGYAGTMLHEIRHLHRRHIPVGYLQIDAWAPVMNRSYPLNSEIKVSRSCFPDGMKAFEKQLALPWIFWSSYYPTTSANVPDSRKWINAAKYLKARGMTTFEEDYLNERYKTSHFDRHLNRGDKFFGAMAEAMAASHLDIMYCMALPAEIMQGAKYSNVTTCRVSEDFFVRPRWRNFIFTSRLVSSLGMWPWAESCDSTSKYGILLQTLSAGMVGFGDLCGHEDRAHIMPAVRSDGIIVKPDVPLLPTGRSYLNQIQHPRRPIIARTWTDQNGVRTVYVFAFAAAAKPPMRWTASTIRQPSGYQGYVSISAIPYSKIVADYHRTVSFSPAKMGLHGPVCVYNYFTHHMVDVPSGGTFVGRMNTDHVGYYVCAATGVSGIAFMGDMSQYVGTGRARIPVLSDQPRGLSATVAFAKGEHSITVGGFAAFKPRVRVRGGMAGVLHYSKDSGEFRVAIIASAHAKETRLEGEPVREAVVTFSKP